MDIVERVKQAMRDNIEAALPSNLVIDYDYPALASIEAAGVRELVEALETCIHAIECDCGFSHAEEIARKALARYRGTP